MSLDQVAAAVGCCKSVVWKQLHRAGVLRSGRETTQLKGELVRRRVLDGWQRGWEAKQCAAAAGCGLRKARAYLRAAGYDPIARSAGQAGCGPLLGAARQGAGLSQRELGRRSGSHQSYISGIESGVINPTPRL